jgi:uncharacterized protein (DUF58 family)
MCCAAWWKLSGHDLVSVPGTTVSDPIRLLRPEVLAGLANLELVARAVVEGFLTGLHRSPMFGFSQEFAEYRPYTEGDDLRFIDWNVYARSDKTYIKRFLGETNSHLVVLLDASASMGFGTGPVNKLQYGKYLAASLAYMSSRQHDAVGCIIFDEEVSHYQPPSTRSGRLLGVLHALDRAQPSRGTNIGKPFEHFRQYSSRRGMVVVISDFYCDAEQMMEGVRPLAFNGQDIILFQLLDPGELKLEFSEATLLEDIETGNAVEISKQFIRDHYPERVQAHIRSLSDAATGVGADHVLVNTAQPLDEALRNYLMFRQRRK